MADDGDGDGDDDYLYDDSETTISVGLALHLMRYSHNSKDAPPALKVDFNKCGSNKALELIGEALKGNTRIEYLQVTLRNGTLSLDSLSDILHFISNNPSLQTLKISGGSDEGNSGEICQIFLNAAAKNKSIHKVEISDDEEGENKGTLPSDLTCIKSCNEVILGDFTEQIGESWPTNHTIKTLRCLEQGAETLRYMSAALKTLEQHASSKGIERLDLYGWSQRVPTYLSSPNSAIRKLYLYKVDFRHSLESGCSAMDGLLLGLTGSQTTNKLYLENCHFDELAIRKLLDALKYDRLSINDLTIDEGLDAFRGEDFLELFSFPCLQSLGLQGCSDDIAGIDSNIEFVKDGLQICSLSSLKISTGPEALASLQGSLSNALRFQSLTSLSLSCCRFSEVDISCLVGLIQDESCHLESLTLEWNESDNDDSVESIILDRLKNNKLLKTLVLNMDWDADTMRVLDAVSNSLPSLKLATLKVFSSEFSFEKHSAQIGNIAEAMKQNWSLDKFVLAGNVYDPEDENFSANPICTPAQNEQISGATHRNRIKKLIFSPALASMEREECINLLASLWELPDWLTLAFWLFEEVPDRFF